MSNEANKQLEAILRAKALESDSKFRYIFPFVAENMLHSAAELRRQHALITELVEALEMSLDEFNGLPHSLGYNFTHTPKLRVLISKAKEQQS